MLSFFKKVILQTRLSKHKKPGRSSPKSKECPYCKGKDPDQLVQMGEGSIKCMGCCNIFNN